MNTFRPGAAVSWAWTTFKARPLIFIGMLGVVLFVNLVASIVLPQGIMMDESGVQTSLVDVVGSIAHFLVSALVGMGMIAFALKAHDSLDTVQLSDLWHPQPFLYYLGTTILLMLIVMAGFILLIIPGIILMVVLYFAPYLVIDKKMGPIQALKESARITKGNRWNLFGLMLLLVGLNILGALLLLVGLLVTIPVSALAIVHAYRTLEHQASELVPSAPATATA